MFRSLLLIALALLLHLSTLQAQMSVVWEPDISMSGGLGGQWSWNTKFVTRVALGQPDGQHHPDAGRVLLAEAQGYVNRRLIGGRRITLGLLFGIENPLDEAKAEKRIIWQYSFRSQAGSISLLHRARIEQRFFEESFQHRIRYRMIADKPLQGEKLDAGEWYLFAGTELLLSSNEHFRKFRIDNRTGIGAGFLFANEHRLQFELQHRAQRMFDKSYASRLWLITSWIIPF